MHEAVTDSLRIRVYRLDLDDQRPVCDPQGPYECVVILGHNGEVER